MNKKPLRLRNICPRCKRKINGEPALSRRDNETEICTNCGTAEALSEHILGGF